MSRVYILSVMAASLLALASCGRNSNMHEATPLELAKPAHFPPPDLPADNPLTVEGVQLGRHLFYDPRLSGDQTQSCASCHLQESNFAEFTAVSTGIDGIQGSMNAMVLSNLAWQQFFFWDGRATSLEEQVLEPVENPIEMHETWPNVIEKLEQDPRYITMFERAYGPNALTKENAAKSLANFIRTLVSGNSKYDQYVRGEYQFTTSEQLGFDIYNNERGDCFHCHGLAGTGYQMGAFGLLQFSNNGLDSILVEGSGREGVTGLPEDRAKFKIPSLRNVEYSFPYMHDGRFQTLPQVIEHYNMGGHASATLDPNMKAVGVGRNWSLAEKQGLLDFLKTFSDPAFLTDTTFSDPW